MGEIRKNTMKRRLHYTQIADTSLAEIAIYIAEASASRPTADKFIARLRDKCRQIASLPGTLGTARPELYAGLRSIPHLEQLRVNPTHLLRSEASFMRRKNTSAIVVLLRRIFSSKKRSFAATLRAAANFSPEWQIKFRGYESLSDSFSLPFRTKIVRLQMGRINPKLL